LASLAFTTLPVCAWAIAPKAANDTRLDRSIFSSLKRLSLLSAPNNSVVAR
jgi:hypothetical protein